MSEKQKTQDGELESVAGGILDNNQAIICGKCQTRFYPGNTPSKSIKDGCTGYAVYKCPTCGMWVDLSGGIHG